MRLVADHDRVGVGDPAGVAHEPLVGLDRDRPVGRVVAVEQRRVDAVAVAAVAQLAVELVDEVAAVGQDQDRRRCARPRRSPSAATVLPAPVACSNQKRRSALGSSGCSSSWTSSSSSWPRPASPAAPRPRSAAVVDVVLIVIFVLVLAAGSSSNSSSSSSSSLASRSLEPRRPRPRPARAPGLRRGGGAVPVAVALGLGQQRGQRPGERVDLVGRQHRPVDQVRLLLGQQPLEPEQQRELAAPLDRRLLGAGVDLGQRSVERPAPGGAGGKGVLEGLALVDEALAREQFRTRNRGRSRKRGGITHEDRKGCVWMCEPRPIRRSGSPVPRQRPNTARRNTLRSGYPLAAPGSEDSVD